MTVATPLMLIAVHLNQIILTKFYPYARPVEWSPEENLYKYSYNWRQLLPWISLSFFILPWVAVFNSSFVLVAYVKSKYTELNILQLFLLVIQNFLAQMVIVNSFDVLRNSKQWVVFLNSLMKFQTKGDNCFVRNRDLKYFYLKNLMPTKSDLKDCTGALDIWGIILNILVIGSSGFALIVLPFIFIFKLDAPYHFFRIVMPQYYFDYHVTRIIIQSVRIFIGSWSTAEGMNIIRSSVVAFFFFLRSYSIHINILKSKSLSLDSILDYRALKVLYRIVSDSFRIIIPVYFGLMYLILVMAQTLTILGYKVIALRYYVALPYGTVMGFWIVHLAWKLAVLIDDHSKELVESWKIKLGRVHVVARDSELFQRKVLRKVVKSIRPISISYGYLGRITRSTRTCYLYSMMYDTVQLILAVRESF